MEQNTQKLEKWNKTHRNWNKKTEHVEQNTQKLEQKQSMWNKTHRNWNKNMCVCLYVEGNKKNTRISVRKKKSDHVEWTIGHSRFTLPKC